MKNIVLLSDGTGNGAAKKNRTNVWRLYRALDLHRDDQIAYYDDGVGSQEFLPLKILGGTIGWGLKRNVIELYKFLCRNYQHGGGADDGDRIYLFGFSRGAFTVRVLAGMIAFCGLYTDYKNEDDLNNTARKNYSAFRSKLRHGLLSRAFRTIFRIKFTARGTLNPGIEFVGVWDTVDAFGLPIDELAFLWDKLIFPIRFPDQRLWIKVKRACHAVSIEDERHTFHPVLWDESQEQELAEKGQVQAGRIEQVWFAGVHSDVGGGYPMSDLSLVPLDWMISKVESAAATGPGLHFIPQIRGEYLSHSDWHGMQHDSRSGFAAYYRYKPREIDRLCNDSDNGVTIDTPKIHRGVLERIQRNAVPYAPTGLPASYQVVSTRGTVPVFETPPLNTARAESLNRALDVVYWRRWLYAALLGATAVLVASRFFLDWVAGEICKGKACVLDPLLKLVINALPNFAAGWIEALRQNPNWLWAFFGVFLILLLLKKATWKATQSRAMAAWSVLKGKGSPPPWKPTVTSKLRQAADSNLRKAIKWITATIVFVLILALLVVLVGRTTFYLRSTAGLLCHNGKATVLTGSQTVTFDISNPCFATGVALKDGTSYRFEVKTAGWTDGGIPAGPDGFTSSKLHPKILLRRHLSEPWFKLMGRIDDAGREDFVIGSGLKEYRARSDGELFLYVNDAVFGFFPGRYWAWPYFWAVGANTGTATVTISFAQE